MRFVFRETLGVELPAPFPVLTYDEAMRDYGTDKPDLRVPLKLADVTDAVKDVEFKVFAASANAPGGRGQRAACSRRWRVTRGELDAYGEYAKALGRKGSPGSKSTNARRAPRGCNRRS